jgi:hypothetical protein
VVVPLLARLAPSPKETAAVATATTIILVPGFTRTSNGQLHGRRRVCDDVPWKRWLATTLYNFFQIPRLPYMGIANEANAPNTNGNHPAISASHTIGSVIVL